MTAIRFPALIVEEAPNGTFRRRIAERSVDDLPPGDVLVRVDWSSLNYKDALSATGNRGVTRRYPHTPGIDAAGVVVESADRHFAHGDPVIISGHDLGQNTPGGWGRYIRVPGDWIVRLPAGLSSRDAMALGTAGFTAALCAREIAAVLPPGDGEVLVTGATGGVGSLAVALLSGIGYAVVAATGKRDRADWLRGLGAENVIGREVLTGDEAKPLLAGRWAAVVETAGGAMLSGALRGTRRGGIVTTCGNAAGADIALTVYPFILRAVRLVGVAASETTADARRAIWDSLAGEWRIVRLDRIARTVSLAALDPEIDRILRGEQVGRVVVAVGEPVGGEA